MGSNPPTTGAGARSRQGAEANHGAKRSYPTIRNCSLFSLTIRLKHDIIATNTESNAGLVEKGDIWILYAVTYLTLSKKPTAASKACF